MADNNAFATIEDIEALWRPLTSEEETRAVELLPVVSDTLRIEAERAGRDLDEMVEESTVYANVVMGVTVDIVVRALKEPTTSTGAALSQESQSALGYSWSGTYAIPGGSNIPILRNDIKRLGLRRQRWGVQEIYAIRTGDNTL